MAKENQAANAADTNTTPNSPVNSGDAGAPGKDGITGQGAPDIVQFQKAIDEMLAKASEKADAIVQGATDKATAIVDEAKGAAEAAALAAEEVRGAGSVEDNSSNAAKRREQRARNHAYLNELVSVRLMKDNNEYRDDVFVSVNGHKYRLKRGVPVRIPRKHALVLEQSLAQAGIAAEFMEQAAGKGREAEAALGLV